MGVEAKTNQYWIAPNAVNITLNALGDPNRIQGAVVSGAVISCYIEEVKPESAGPEYAGNGDGLLLDNGRNPKRWPLSLSPTYFNTDTEKYVYAAIPRSVSIGTQAVIVFPSERLDIYGKNNSDVQVGSTDYFYIWLRGVISSTDGTTARTWTTYNDYGTLGTYEDIIDMSETDWYIYSKITDIVTFLKEIIMAEGSSFRNLILNNKSLTDIATSANATVNSDTMVASPGYIQRNYLSKVSPDTAQGRITFADGWTANGAALLNSIMKSGNFVSGLQGWQMDALGNGEVESMRVRSVLEVTELLINRLQAQEGDTLFTDNDQIEDVEEVDVGGETLYILTLKEKWEGYFTAQQYGNVIKGIINTLAAKEAGISDYQSASVETDGANKFYTSWMRVEADRDTDQSLGDNQIMVSLYGDSDTPAGKNFPPCKLMTIARWGCHDYSNPTSADYAAVLASIKRRQQLFYLSAKDGRIVKLVGVDQPKLRNGNIGTSLGTLPDFVLDYANVRDRVNAGRDYLYAQGIVVSDFVKIDAAGDYVCIDVDKGEWQDNTDYLAGGYNAVTQQYERHFVTHRGCRWMCKYNQPRNGVYVEPAWNSSSWQLSEGNQNLSMEIVSTNGDKFRRDIVNTVLTPHLFYGNMDITADISAASWAWTRESDSGKTAADTAWDASHRGSVTGVKTLALTNSDMPEGWSSTNRAIFTCTVSVNDGENTVIVQNQATV